MKRSMAGEIVATGEHDARLRPKCLYGGAMWTHPITMARVMADEGAEIGKKVTRWVNM